MKDYPTYTIPEAALFLGMPSRTLSRWFAGESGLLVPSGKILNVSLLSFNNVVEAYAILLLRSKYRLPPQSIRQALKYLPKVTDIRNPLISENLKVFESYILYELPANKKTKRQIVNLSKDGQLAIPKVVDVWANRVLRDSSGKPKAIFPWRLWKDDQHSKPVEIDPTVMSGRLVLTGTRIPVNFIAGRKRSGESIEEIAQDYGLPTESVAKALQHIDRKAA